MYPLTAAEANILVRKNFDELNINPSDMYDAIDDNDSNEFDEVLSKTLPEAINIVHLTAPANLLDGICLTASELEEVKYKDGDPYVLGIRLKKALLRLVAFKATDSAYVVSEVTPEYSARGRMQLNEYTRGTADNPCLVELQGKDAVIPQPDTHAYITRLEYYSLDTIYPSPSAAIGRFEYIPRYWKTEDSYGVAENLVQNVIDQLTGLLLNIFGRPEDAKVYLDRASFVSSDNS